MNVNITSERTRRAPALRVALPIAGAATVLIAVGAPAPTAAGERDRSAPATTAASPVSVKDAYGERHRRPRTFAFSANGDLIGAKLRWSNWGRRVATARGYLVESPRPAGSPGGVALRGTVRFSRIVTCPDGRYYATARITFDRPSKALWIPKNLNITPC